MAAAIPAIPLPAPLALAVPGGTAVARKNTQVKYKIRDTLVFVDEWLKITMIIFTLTIQRLK